MLNKMCKKIKQIKLSTINCCTKQKMFFKKIQLGIISIFSSPLALADSGQNSVASFINNVCNLLTGDIATGIAVLAVIVLGYQVMKGKMDWHRALSIVIGLGLIYGGSYYGKTVIGGGF